MLMLLLASAGGTLFETVVYNLGGSGTDYTGALSSRAITSLSFLLVLVLYACQ